MQEDASCIPASPSSIPSQARGRSELSTQRAAGKERFYFMEEREGEMPSEADEEVRQQQELCKGCSWEVSRQAEQPRSRAVTHRGSADAARERCQGCE